MRLHRIFSMIVLLCLLPMGLRAQNDAQVSMYWSVPTFFNPAQAGQDSALHITAFNRMQWVGVENAPQTFFVSADMPFNLFNKQHGVGLTLINDQAGLFTNTFFAAQYAAKLKLWGGQLSLALQMGAVNEAFAGGDIYIPDGDAWEGSDESLPTSNVSAMSFDCAFGAYYSRGVFYGGISAQHLNAATIDLDEFAYSELSRLYYFNVGCNIPIKRTLFIVQPSILAKTTFQATQIDWTIRATYDSKYWGGLTYRHGDAVVLQVGIDLKNIRLGYAYDIGTSALASTSSGSHELMATYTLKMNLGKKEKFKHKSIRIL